MELTPELKAKIDAMPYAELLRLNRFAPIGDPMFAGDSGTYILTRMRDMRAAPGGHRLHVSASKAVGWMESGR